MFSNMMNGQFQEKIARLHDFYQQNRWPDQWFYDILREIHIWSLYSVRHGGKYQIPEGQKTWFDFIFSGRLVRIGRLMFDIKGRFGGRIKVFKREKSLAVLAEPGLVFNENGYRSEHGWSSSLEETDICWKGNLISGGIALRKTVSLDKREWTMALQYEDPMLGIHIPDDGPMTKESCLHSLQEASLWFGKSENNWKGFFCQSWILDPKFSKILPASSNIVQFQSLGYLYPMGLESDVKNRVYPGKLRNLVNKEEKEGHKFMQGGLFLLKEDLSPLFISKQEIEK